MSEKKVIAVNLTRDLLEVLERSKWHNRSLLVELALEEYIQCHDPKLYKILEVMRNA